MSGSNSHPLIPFEIEGIPSKASSHRHLWDTSYRHMQGCYMQAQVEDPSLAPVPSFDVWVKRLFRAAGSNMHAMWRDREI